MACLFPDFFCELDYTLSSAGGHPGQARQLLNGILHKHPSLRILYQLTER